MFAIHDNNIFCSIGEAYPTYEVSISSTLPSLVPLDQNGIKNVYSRLIHGYQSTLKPNLQVARI